MEQSQVAKVELEALAAKDMDFPSSSLVMDEDKVDVLHDKVRVCDPIPPGELEDSMIGEECVGDATEVCHSCTHDHNCHYLHRLNLLLDFISAGSHNEFITA